jgi:hypothetical protein
MAKRTHINRLKISDSMVFSARAFVGEDYKSAAQFADEVLKQAGAAHHLTDNEQRYLAEVFRRAKRKKK